MKTRDEIEAMTDEERLIATAEATGNFQWWKGEVGWKTLVLKHKGEASNSAFEKVENRPTTDGWDNARLVLFLPDYLNSLDSMAQAEKVFPEYTELEYASYLVQICCPKADPLAKDYTLEEYAKTILATARQRNTAFLMVMLPDKQRQPTHVLPAKPEQEGTATQP